MKQVWRSLQSSPKFQAFLRFLKRECQFTFTRKLVKGDRGIALMMAIFTVTMLMVIATEVVYETSVEFLVSSQKVNQLKAYYAAKAGIEISLLRIHIYQKAMAQFGDMLPTKSMLDPIWQFPFAWPPPVPKEMSIADKDEIKTVVKKSAMQASYAVTIQSEGSKIDINDLASPSKTVREATRKQLKQLFDSKMENDEKFRNQFNGFDFDKLLNNIADWASEGKESLNGGDKKALYPDANNDFIPPNEPFKTLQELHMVAGMTDAIYDILAPRITVFGIKGINVNYASKDVLMSLDPQITAPRADQIVMARNDPHRGPFKDLKDFEDYLATIGCPANMFSQGKESKDLNLPLLFDAEYNFRIVATGKSGKIFRDIVAITYDFDRVKARLADVMAKESPTATPTATPSGGATAPPAGAKPGGAPAKKDIKVPNERPTVIYWNEG